MNDDRIKELLDSTAPDRPDLLPAARTTAVRGRARAVRRRNRFVLAAAVVAMVGVGVGVPVLTSGDEPTRQQQVASDPPASSTEPPACPTEPIDVDDLAPVEALPDGATSVRACQASRAGVGPGDGGAEAQTLPPGPIVGADAEEFVRAVDALPAYTLEDECALIMVTPVPWTVVVGYPDGTSQTLGTTSQVCAALPVGGVDRSAEEVVRLYYRAAGVDPEGEPGPAATSDDGDGGGVGCPGHQTGVESSLAAYNTYDGDLADFEPASGAICHVAGPDTGSAFPHPDGLIDSTALGDLGDDLLSHATTSPQRTGRCTDTGPRRLFLLSDADNQAVALADSSCTGELAGRGVYWIPDTASAQALQTAMDDAGFE